MTQWLSLHLRFDGALYGAEGDALVRRGVGDFVRAASRTGTLRRYFFVRYVDEGPHVRLRLMARSEEARRQLRAAARSATFRAVGATRGVRWVNYEPELDRYGGATALPVAERLFHASSRFALEQLHPELSVDRSRRLGVAALAMLVQLRAGYDTKAEARAAAADYHVRYLGAMVQHTSTPAEATAALDRTLAPQLGALQQRFAGLWEQLGDLSVLPSSVARFSRALQRERQRLTKLAAVGGVVVNEQPCPDWPRAAAALLPSFLHMTNNRLGVSIPEEVLLASAITEVLDAR